MFNCRGLSRFRHVRFSGSWKRASCRDWSSKTSRWSRIKGRSGRRAVVTRGFFVPNYTRNVTSHLVLTSSLLELVLFVGSFCRLQKVIYRWDAFLRLTRRVVKDAVVVSSLAVYSFVAEFLDGGTLTSTRGSHPWCLPDYHDFRIFWTIHTHVHAHTRAGAESIYGDVRAINTLAASPPAESAVLFLISFLETLPPCSGTTPVRFLCHARTVYAIGRTMATTEFAGSGYWIASDKWSDSVRGN